MYNPQIETFLKVADAGSFSKASEQMYISPTAVIKQINLLENELNLQLFVRTHRGLTLTKAGKSLYKDAKYIIDYSKDAVLRAQKAMQETEDTIRIGISPMTPGQFLLDIWDKIHVKYPDMKFQLVPYANTPENAREILKNLGDNIDLVAGVFDEKFLQTHGCKALKLCMTPICCGVSIHHRLAEKKILSLDDLSGENLMIITEGWNKYIDELRRDLQKNRPDINITDFPFYSLDVFNQCENSNGILTVIPNWVNTHPLIKIIPVDWNYKVPFGIMHAPNPTPHVRQLLQTIEEILLCL